MHIDPYTEMVDGRPVEHSYTGKVFTELITDLSKEDQDKVFGWIKRHMIPRKSRNTRHTSYGLKHFLQEDTGIYLLNNQFKDAMLMAGHVPVDYSKLNWVFCISEKPLTKRREEKGF